MVAKMSPDEYMQAVIFFYTDVILFIIFIIVVCACLALGDLFEACGSCECDCCAGTAVVASDGGAGAGEAAAGGAVAGSLGGAGGADVAAASGAGTAGELAGAEVGALSYPLMGLDGTAINPEGPNRTRGATGIAIN